MAARIECVRGGEKHLTRLPCSICKPLLYLFLVRFRSSYCCRLQLHQRRFHYPALQWEIAGIVVGIIGLLQPVLRNAKHATSLFFASLLVVVYNVVATFVITEIVARLTAQLIDRRRQCLLLVMCVCVCVRIATKT